MISEHIELDAMQRAYKAAVGEWLVAIRKEEDLSSTNHELAEVDRWEQAHYNEEEARSKVISAKASYETSLRAKFFKF